MLLVLAREDGSAKCCWTTVIRTLAIKCCYEVSGGEHHVLADACLESGLQVCRRLAMRVEVPGCSRACVRNENIPGFTTDYKDLVKRLPQLVVLS